VIAFSSALCLTFADNSSSSLPALFFNFIQMTVGIGHAADEVWNSHEIAAGQQSLFEGILFTYYILMLIMVNLLIAMLSSTYALKSEPEAARAMLVIEKHNKMRGMVSTLIIFQLCPYN